MCLLPRPSPITPHSPSIVVPSMFLTEFPCILPRHPPLRAVSELTWSSGINKISSTAVAVKHFHVQLPDDFRENSCRHSREGRVPSSPDGTSPFQPRRERGDANRRETSEIPTARRGLDTRKYILSTFSSHPSTSYFPRESSGCFFLFSFFSSSPFLSLFLSSFICIFFFLSFSHAPPPSRDRKRVVGGQQNGSSPPPPPLAIGLTSKTELP